MHQMAVGYAYYTRVHSQPFIYKSSSFGRSNGIDPLSSLNVKLVVCKNIVRFEENLNARLCWNTEGPQCHESLFSCKSVP